MKDYKQETEKFIQAHKYLTLATAAEDGQAFAHTVGYAEDGAVLYFATGKDTQKIKNITANPKAGYTIDMSENTDWSELQGLQMIGKASILTDEAEINKANALLIKKFPQLAEMPEEFEAVFVKVEPVRGRFLDSTVHFGYHADLVY